MPIKETESNGTTYEYHSENEGQPFGEVEQYTMPDAVDYFHGDGRAAFRISPHAAFVTQGNQVHLHALPHQDEQCPEDPHTCLGKWNIENFGTMLDGLRVIEKGVEVDAGPKQILETMEDKLGDLSLGSGTEGASEDDDHIHRIN
jgi:hypothetical protein